MIPNLNGSLRPLRILVVSSSPFARAGLAGLIAAQPGLAVAAQISTDEDLIDALDLYHPDAIVWEMGWEPLQFLDRLTELRDAAGRALIAVLALIADDPGAVSAAALLLNAGARGVMMQDTNPDRLAAALMAIGQGLTVVTPTYLPVTAPAVPDPVSSAAEATVDALTPREAEVLHLIAEGLPNKIIAHKLSISEHTVKFHVNAILTKLGAQSRTEAVVRATRAGLIAL
ncbi:MAG: response regulator transcription factor [bacterium]|nr:response regulator transcription factor [bacterium]